MQIRRNILNSKNPLNNQLPIEASTHDPKVRFQMNFGAKTETSNHDSYLDKSGNTSFHTVSKS